MMSTSKRVTTKFVLLLGVPVCLGNGCLKGAISLDWLGRTWTANIVETKQDGNVTTRVN